MRQRAVCSRCRAPGWCLWSPGRVVRVGYLELRQQHIRLRKDLGFIPTVCSPVCRFTVRMKSIFHPAYRSSAGLSCTEGEISAVHAPKRAEGPAVSNCGLTP